MGNVKLGILRQAWRRWLKFAELLGNIQMMVLLSLVYWFMFTLVAVPFRLLSDPLALRHPSRARWVSRAPISHVLDSMRRQG